jgi:sugar lactone lactonase YvrE
MSLPDPVPTLTPEAQRLAEVSAREESKRRRLLLILLVLLLGLCAVLYVIIRYLLNPAPIADLLPVPVARGVSYPPTYKFSIQDVSGPVGVGISADGQRIYVAESSGERYIKMFDRDGRLIQRFAPPGTTFANRLPTYIAVNPDGRVFVTDNYNHTINVFDPAGNFIDSIIGVDQTVSEVVAAANNGAIPAGATYFYNNIDKKVYYQVPDQDVKALDITPNVPWAPLGLRFDADGNLLVTNVVKEGPQIIIFPAAGLAGSWLNFEPAYQVFAEPGSGDGQLSYANSVVKNSSGNFFVSDGNNARISYWTPDQKYIKFFGYGSDATAFNLPRGAWIDGKDRLHVADAVGQSVRVYDVSQSEPVFLYSFGEFGITEGMFNYPTDICLDSGGRLYIADRENNRVQIWSY